MHRRFIALVSFAAAALWASTGFAAEEQPRRLSILFLGDGGHHQPARRFESIKPVLAARGIDATYSADSAALAKENLAKFDGVLIYRDSGDLPAAAEQALNEFVEGGKGLVAVHCASHAFRNSRRYTALVGGRVSRSDYRCPAPGVARRQEL
jgi:type 1 glutamine amidotransferase